MSSAYLFLVLVALPALVMTASWVYAVTHQHETGNYTVILGGRENPGPTIQQHVRTYKLSINQVFDGTVKGYSASVPIRNVERLRKDPRVAQVEAEDSA